MSNSRDGGPLTFEEIVKLSPEEIARYTGIVAGKNHITLVIPRTLKGPDCDCTYFQSVCSCGWTGDYKSSKLTAQLDTCPNRPIPLKETAAHKEAEVRKSATKDLSKYRI